MMQTMLSERLGCRGRDERKEAGGLEKVESVASVSVRESTRWLPRPNHPPNAVGSRRIMISTAVETDANHMQYRC